MEENGEAIDVMKINDTQVINCLLERIGVRTQPESFTRLGKPNKNKRRTIKVTMKNNQDKENVMSNLRRLKDYAKEFGKISVTDDYTSGEREQIRCWVKKAEEKSSKDPEYVYRVGGNPKSGLRLVTFTRQAKTQQRLINGSEHKKLIRYTGLKCLYSNVDQLFNKMDGLLMQITFDEPDIMMFTEVIPKAQKIPILETQVSIDSYKIFTNFNFTDPNLGASVIRGGAIYVKDKLYFKEVQLKSIYDDHVWVEIRLMNGDSLLCGCIYRSPAKDRTESTKNVCDIISEAVHRNNSHRLVEISIILGLIGNVIT